jgi:hypothetical protein
MKPAVDFGYTNTKKDESTSTIETTSLITGSWRTVVGTVAAKERRSRSGSSEKKAEDEFGDAIKIAGEFPQFGVPTPPRLLRIIEDDRDEFLKGRRCEFQGLGIGAFTYYRRVVENQKGRLIDAIADVAKKSGANESVIARFEKAKKETRFEKVVDDLSDVIPSSLLLAGGHNPLKLLHGPLSKGIHNKSDQDCLEYATSIRVVLAELAERIGFALQDGRELETAVSRLLQIERS